MTGSRGPLSKPTDIRSLKGGRPTRQSLSDIPADELGAAVMPTWLSREAKAFWRRNAPVLEPLGLLTKLDETTFAMLCDAWAQLRELDRQIDKDGHVITGPRGGTRLHPLLGTRNKVLHSVVEGMRAFGMTPASRQRINVTPPRKPVALDPMEVFLQGRPRRATSDPRDVLRE